MVGSVIITGTSSGGFGIDTGSWPTGVTLALQVNGTVRGGGGKGGDGAEWAFNNNGSDGGTGGDAIRCNAPIAITVDLPGAVFGGGGGGTSGSGGNTIKGSGGGTGGSTATPGGDGGDYGAAGADGEGQFSGSGKGGNGGAAGYAVRKNGTGCTVTGTGLIRGTVG